MKKISSGKVRNIFAVDGDKLVLVTSDRISAFDEVLPNTVPGKGTVLNKMSAFWFTYTKDICQNHMISVDNADMPEYFQKEEFDGRCMLVKSLKMLPIECIVRGYITGSGWSSYKKSGCVCGIELPEGLQESEKLPTPIYTPTTKATEGHDMPISFEDTIELLGGNVELAALVRDMSIKLYETCAEYALQKGIIIADTKFEFGLDEEGNLVIGDEMLTPDSSRFWPADEYEIGRSQNSFDKQYLRDYIKATNNGTYGGNSTMDDILRQTSDRYTEALHMLTT